jgi:protein HOOK3
MLTSSRPFLEQNEKLQATETELQDLQRQFREKELENAELRNELSKGTSNSSSLTEFDLPLIQQVPRVLILRARNSRRSEQTMSVF